MAGVLAWLRWDLRRRWVSLAVLGLLTAFATGTVLTAAAGAHRGDTALPRLRAQTRPTDALVVANLPGIDWGPVDALPYVTAYSHFFLGGGGGKFPEDDITSVTSFARDDPHWMRSIERPVVLEGRMLDVNDPLEAVITRGVEDRGYHVGQVLPYRLASPAQADRAELDELPYADLAGPELQIRIVGVVISPWALQDGGAAVDVELSPALLQRYRSSFTGTSGKAGWENDQLRLAHGAADIPQLREDLKRITGQAIDVWNYDEGYDHLQATDRREAGFLLAFAIAALVASMLLIGQALGRSVATSVAELDSARALGMEPRQVTVAAVLGPVAACWAGAVLGGVVAAYASRWFPIGTAASAEPAPGTRIDWPVLAVGLLLVAGLLLAGALLSALSAASTRAAARGGESSITRLAANLRAPVPVTMGLRFALERGRGRTATPVRPALLGAVVGVIGVVAVGVFGHGVRDAVDHPERFGETYQAFGFVGFQGHDFVPAARMVGALDAMPEVAGIDDAHAQVADFPHGTGSVQLWSWDPGTKPLATTVLDGRMPESSNEVALGWLDMKRQGLEVGDTTELTSGSVTRTYTVVGRTLMPEGPHNAYDESGWITRAGYDQLFKDDKFHVLFLSLAPDARNAAGLARVNQQVFAALPKVKALAESQCRGNSDPSCLWTVNTPASQQLSIGTNGVTESLRQTRELPYLLAAFLILLAVAAIAHALVSAVRRRAVDLAVLRAGGMTPVQSRTIVVVQACALAVVGLVFGLPLGIALGRTAWRWIAYHFPLQYVAPGDLVLVLATIPAVVVIVNLLAALPARRAARGKVAAILRAE